MLTKPFLDAKAVLIKIEEANHRAYFVGGCVRDLLLQREIRDVDIATSASPEQIQQIFPKVIPVGIEHGTVIVRYAHISYEVTTFRVDGKYSDQRHPDNVQFIDKIDEDLKRRDFTINALAMDKDGNIIDLFKGKLDIHNKVIRTVGDGYERFMEDPLRIIRALRFSSQLGFTIEEKTLNNMRNLKGEIESLAMERISSEFTKLFAGEFINTGIDYLIRSDVYKHLPIMIEYPYIIEKLPSVLQPFHSFGEVIALFHYMEPAISISNWIKAWKCSNKIRQEAIQLIDSLRYYEKNGLDSWLVYNLSFIFYHSFVGLVHHIYPNDEMQLKNLKEMKDSLPIKMKQDLAIDGNDLLAIFPNAKKGPWIQQLINDIERQVVLKQITNSKSNLKEWIKCNPPEIN